MNSLASRHSGTQKYNSGSTQSIALRLHAYQIVLWILFLGPPIAALFIATRLPLIADTGQLAHDLLSFYICPTPALAYTLFDAPMAVCARCWGATIGLWIAYFLARHPAFTLYSRYAAQTWPLRLLIAALPFLLWLAEIRAWPSPWPGITAPLYITPLLNGIQAGIFAGLFFYSLVVQESTKP